MQKEPRLVVYWSYVDAHLVLSLPQNIYQCSMNYWKADAENIPLLHKGKYHCTANLLCHWFGFDQTCKSASKLNINKVAESKPVKQEVSHTVILPLTK